MVFNCFFKSGYAFIDIPCIIGNEFHDTHHRLTQCNYGSYGYIDALFGSHRLVPKNDKTEWINPINKTTVNYIMCEIVSQFELLDSKI